MEIGNCHIVAILTDLSYALPGYKLSLMFPLFHIAMDVCDQESLFPGLSKC